MDRRAFLSLLPAGLGGLAGCGTPGEETETPSPEEVTTRERPTVSPAERLERRVAVWNPTTDPVFATVVVTRDDREVFFENADLNPGEQRTSVADVPAGDNEVLVETDTGVRGEATWHVEPGLDGYLVVLGREAAQFWRAVSCVPADDCSVALGGGRGPDGSVDLPLVGDGRTRWYAPARVVLENPGPKTVAGLRVDLYDETLLDRRYRLPAGTRVAVPLTYRTGRYRVTVTTDERTVESAWRVPNEPTKSVDVTSGVTGCGPANTTLTVANRDDERHRLSLRVEASTGTFDRTLELAAGEVRELVPVVESGPHEVRARLDTGRTLTATWWSCPPRGPASVVVDATGDVSLVAGGPQPG